MIPQHGTVEEIRPASCGWLFLNLTGRTNANSIDSSRALKNVHSLATRVWVQSWELGC